MLSTKNDIKHLDFCESVLFPFILFVFMQKETPRMGFLSDINLCSADQISPYISTEKNGLWIDTMLSRQSFRATPKPLVLGSSPSAPAKKSKSKDLDFFICVRRTQHHLRATHASSFECQLNIIAAPRGTNERCCTSCK